MFRFHLSESAPQNYREAYLAPSRASLLARFVGHLFDGGLLMVETGTGILSTAMGGKEIDRLAEIAVSALRKIKPELDR